MALDDEMGEDVKTRVMVLVSEYNRVDSSPEIALHESASEDLSLDIERDKGICTILLPIQGYHLNSLLPECRWVKVVTCNPRKTGVHSHQVS